MDWDYTRSNIRRFRILAFVLDRLGIMDKSVHSHLHTEDKTKGTYDDIFFNRSIKDLA